MTTDTITSARELTITRVLNAPVKLVWQVWTQPDHIKNWWGPNGFTNTIFKMDVQPGGEWDFMMHGPDGTDFKNKSVYKEVVKGKKLVYDHVTGPNFQFTVTFSEKENKTLITIQMLFETAQERNNVVKVFKADVGLVQNMYKLEGYLRKISSEREMTLTRIINAPRLIVFKAWVEPDQLAKWWGPAGFANPVCKVEANPGGKILIHMKGPDGTIYPMDGEFHEIVEPSKIVFTSAALDEKGNRLFEVLNTITFTEEGEQTRLTVHAAVSSITEQARPYLDGMNTGWSQSIDRLAELAKNAPVIVEKIFNIPVEKVWEALTDPVQLKKWYFDISSFKPERGFQFQFYGEGAAGEKYLHLCEIIEVIPLKKLQYSWRYDGYAGTSRVTWELSGDDNSTRVRVVHESLESFSENGPGFQKKNFAEGWTYIVEKSLSTFLDR